ncbi:MAG: amidohydrolase family protein [Opitutaceae bacterium]|nr:amidohydrolase family protein [Opitutaceae bacterium]
MRIRTLLSALAGAAMAALLHGAPALLVRNGLLMTMEPGQETPFIGYMVVDDDGRISALGAGDPPTGAAAPRTVDATGRFVVPGFISAHSHIWQSAFRGLAADQYVRGWVDVVYRQRAMLASPEDFYWFTLHGSLDHLRHGITSAFNFTYGNRDGYAEQQWRAELDSGIRFVHGYQRRRDAPESQAREALAAFMAAARPDFSRPTFLRMALSGTATSEESVAIDARLMKEFGLANQTHYLEFPLNKEEQRANFRFIAAAGLLGPDFYFGHFIHTDETMLKAVAAARSGMSWNPLSNGRLASGIADIPRYLTLGVKVGMGVDGQASADLPDPFENMRMGLYMIRAKYESALVMQPYDVLRLHTLGSAQVMGVEDRVGTLKVGKFGDFLLVDPASVDRAPVDDAYATLVFACNAQNLDRVFVGGVLTSESSRLVNHDFARAQREVRERVEEVRRRARALASP